MKRNKVGIAIAAIALLFAASAFTISEANKGTKLKKVDTYYWFETNDAGTSFQPSPYIGAFLSNNHMGAKSASSCDDLTNFICARGYLQSQLADPSQPGSNLNLPPSASVGYSDQIVKSTP